MADTATRTDEDVRPVDFAISVGLVVLAFLLPASDTACLVAATFLLTHLDPWTPR